MDDQPLRLWPLWPWPFLPWPLWPWRVGCLREGQDVEQGEKKEPERVHGRAPCGGVGAAAERTRAGAGVLAGPALLPPLRLGQKSLGVAACAERKKNAQ